MLFFSPFFPYPPRPGRFHGSARKCPNRPEAFLLAEENRAGPGPLGFGSAVFGFRRSEVETFLTSGKVFELIGLALRWEFWPLLFWFELSLSLSHSLLVFFFGLCSLSLSHSLLKRTTHVCLLLYVCFCFYLSLSLSLCFFAGGWGKKLQEKMHLSYICI